MITLLSVWTNLTDVEPKDILDFGKECATTPNISVTNVDYETKKVGDKWVSEIPDDLRSELPWDGAIITYVTLTGQPATNEELKEAVLDHIRECKAESDKISALLGISPDDSDSEDEEWD